MNEYFETQKKKTKKRLEEEKRQEKLEERVVRWKNVTILIWNENFFDTFEIEEGYLNVKYQCCI